MARKSSSSADPAELFRADLITAMKVSDLRQLQPGSYLTIKEPWRKEWEIGVQVCTNPTSLPTSKTEIIADPPEYPGNFELPLKMICKDHTSPTYYCDEVDLCWLEAVNKRKKLKAISKTEVITPEDLQKAIVAFELKCQRSMARAIATEEDFAIQYDDSVACDVCREKEGEENNEMIFCDSCNICVHQACYGVTSIPQFTWLCRPCAAYDTSAQCVLCPNEGGALKKTQYGSRWVHVSCALWIPEVGIGNIDKMEPITKVEDVPNKRWSLVCCICKKKHGACIQCSFLKNEALQMIHWGVPNSWKAENCIVSYHVTCGFKSGLEMKSRFDSGALCVFNEAYCPRHTAMRKSNSGRGQFTLDRKKAIKSTRLQEMEDEFYTHVTLEEVATELNMKPQYCELFYNYWKLKRKSNHNHPLLSVSDVKDVIEEIKEGLLQKSKNDAECYQAFMKLVRIRQDLEKSRNLGYMVQKREQLKKRQISLEEDIVMSELEVANATPLPDPSTVIPRRKRGRPRKKVVDHLQPAAKMRRVNPEEENLEKQSTVGLSKQTPSHSTITKTLVVASNTCKDENKARPADVDCKLNHKLKVKEVSVPLQRYPLRRNGHVLCESKPALHCNNNVLLQKKQPLIVIKKCHELQRLYNVSFSCKGKINQCSDPYYLRNGWKQEFHPR